MEWLLLPAAAALAWYLGKRKTDQPPPPPPPPPGGPIAVIHSATIQADIWGTTIFGRIHQGTVKVKLPLNQEKTFMLSSAVCGFRGTGRVDSNGDYVFVGQNQRQWKVIEVTWRGSIRQGETIQLAENSAGIDFGGGFGIDQDGKICLIAT